MSHSHLTTTQPQTAGSIHYFKNDRLYYVWLIFSAYYFIPIFVIPLSGWALVLALLGYGAFVSTYIGVRYLPQNRWYLAIIAMLSIATACSFITPGASNFFMYSGFFLGVMLPLGYFIGAVSLVLLGTYFLGEALHYPFLFFSLYIMIGAPTIGMIGVIERMRVQNAKREQHSTEQIRSLAQSLERERIARDLHDVIGHTLSTIALKAELAQKLLLREKSEQAANELTQLQAITRDGLRQVRETISGVHRTNLADELINLALRMREQNIQFLQTGAIPALNKKTDSALALILRELTTNLLRHSNADRCELAFKNDDDMHTMTVSDNGTLDDLTEGNGLTGIRQRLHLLGGQLSITTVNGFCVKITLPKDSDSTGPAS
ncbi:sensor histidine kinase [Gilvimarinus japonicus]|uniref:Sensor histidine kinase n=1 Tax=Gilvimarinus japonicus TaxID=1796469 RepID=A0ABV7HQK9_9GAMM